MKILHLSMSDIKGGAARAAYRLHQSLKEINIDSQMLVQDKYTNDCNIVGPISKINSGISKIRPTLDLLPVQYYKNKTQTLFSPSWLPLSGIENKIKSLSPDIVHLHWICGGMMRIEEIAAIEQPIVLSLHDMWAFTGGCHYNEDCLKYKTLCEQCTILRSSKKNDLSLKIFKRKSYIYNLVKHRLTIVGLSQWISKCALESTLLESQNIVNLPNPINTNIFSPIDKDTARNILNLPKDKKLLLFGAVNAVTDKRKGFKELIEALSFLSTEVELVVFGSHSPKESEQFKQKVHYLGHLHDDISLRILYSAVDVTIAPSLQENLSNTIMESLSCGTPVIGFNIGGNADLIDHQKGGYLAKPFCSHDLAEGINWILNSNNYLQMSKYARQKVLNNFSSMVVAQKYVSLYKKILNISTNH